MHASSVKSSASSTVGAIPALDSSFSPDASQYDGVLASGGIGPSGSVHVLWDLGSSVTVSSVSAWASSTAEAWSSVDGTSWTDLGLSPSTGLSVSGAARYIQFTLSGAGSQIYETSLKDSGGTIIGPPVPAPVSPGAPTIGARTTSSIAVGLPSFPANTTSLTLLRATDTGSGLGSFSTLVSNITIANSIYTDSSAISGRQYAYAVQAVGLGGTSPQGPASTEASVTAFRVTPSSLPLSIHENTTATLPLAISSLNGFAGTVALSSEFGFGFTTSFSPSFVSGTGTITESVFASATPGNYTLSFTATGNDGGTPSVISVSIPVIVLAPLVPNSAEPVVFYETTQNNTLAFVGDLPAGASSMVLQIQAPGGSWTNVQSVTANTTVTLTGLSAGTAYNVRIVSIGPGGNSNGQSSILNTLPLVPTLEVPWLPSGPAVRLGPRVPNGSVGLAFIDIPSPDPSTAAVVLDLSRSSRETASSRGLSLGISGTVTRESSGPRPDPGSTEQITFITNQAASSLPVRVSRIDQNPAGGWEPIATRGLFYRALTMEDDPRSWLWRAGFRPGQRLLAAYTTEMDWANLANPGASSGTLQRVRKQATPNGPLVNLSSQTVGMLGGLQSLSGVELLATPNASGVVGNLTWEVFPAADSSSLGRVRSSIPTSFGQVELSSLSTGAPFSSFIPQDVSKSVVRLSGSLRAAAEALYNISCVSPGTTRVSFWNCPIVDRWYSPTPSQNSILQVYLHAGWHDFSVEIAPQSTGSFSLSAEVEIEVNEFTTGYFPTGFLPAGYTGYSGTSRNMQCSSGTPVGSYVSSIDLVRGTVSLLGSWSTDVQASFTEEASCPIRGYFDDLGKWRGLDLNPSFGHTYDSGKPTSDWLLYPCVIYVIPSLVCALTDSYGNRIPPEWVSASGYIRSCLRWAQASDSISPSLDAGNFGESSLFIEAVLGSSIYNSGGGASGVTEETNGDLYGGYLSASPLAIVNISSGLPAPSSNLLHDVRVLGGGLGPQDRPWTYTGQTKERADTHWDISTWDGNDSVAGKVLVRIPSAYLTGADGMIALSRAEIEDIVRQSLAAGIEPVIEFV